MKNAVATGDGGIITAVFRQLPSEELEPLRGSRNVQEMAYLCLVLCVSTNIKYKP